MWCPVCEKDHRDPPKPDLLSIAGQLAEAARKAYDGNMLFHHRKELGEALYKWDAARREAK